MKKMGMMCMMVTCLAMPSLSSEVPSTLGIYLNCPEQEAERIKEDLKDAEKLRAFMEKIVGSLDSDFRRTPFMMKAFQHKFGVNDGRMQTALTNIIRKESEISSKSGEKDYHNPNLLGAIRWLGCCADAEGKKLLHSIITDKAKDISSRMTAAFTYLRCADAQEFGDAFDCFFADANMWTVSYTEPYRLVMLVYEEAEGNPKKREAIVATMSAKLAKDERAFAEADLLLAARSKEYAESPQRKAALERIEKQQVQKAHLLVERLKAELAADSTLDMAALRAKAIYAAIIAANEERAPVGLGPVWPKAGRTWEKKENVYDIHDMEFDNSSDYFWVLYDGENIGTDQWCPSALPLSWPLLVNGKVPAKEWAGQLLSDTTAWTIAGNLTSDMPVCIPVIVSRNVDPASLIPGEGDLKAQRVRPSKEFTTPFGDDGFVVVQKGGGVSVISWKDASLYTIYQGADIQEVRSALQKIMYLTPRKNDGNPPK